MLNISFTPEYVISIAGFRLTNTFLTTILVTLLIIVLVLIGNLSPKKKKKGLRAYLAEASYVFIIELLQLIDMVTEDRKMTKRVLPLIATLFFFIVSANVIGLLPGFLGSFYLATPAGQVPLVRTPNSDLTTTLALAIFTVSAIQIFSLKSFGLKGYLKRFVNFANPVAFVLGFFELISEAVKVLSFSFRLFGNIFAGEILLLVIGFLLPYVIPLPFMILEVFVGIIQAFIFAVLALTFIKTGSMRQAQSPSA